MTRFFGKIFSALFLLFLFSGAYPLEAQKIISSGAKEKRRLLGIELRPRIESVVDEIEKKTGHEIVAVFESFDRAEEEGILGVSFIHTDGIAYVGAKTSLRLDSKRLEAVLAHELFHLRQRLRGYPTFMWSEKVKTKKGPAHLVEQSNVNSLHSLIDHRFFQADLEQLGLYKYLDLSDDAIRAAREEGHLEDGQAQAIDFCRAVLEFQDAKKLETYRRIYIKNGWRDSIKIGEAMAAIIKEKKITTAAEFQTVFSDCLIKLYKLPRAMKFRRDPTMKHYRRMVIET
ncbi:MAG: hypothetical protein R2747_08890 [Pyrinomonadaceae bacterium]